MDGWMGHPLFVGCSLVYDCRCCWWSGVVWCCRCAASQPASQPGGKAGHRGMTAHVLRVVMNSIGCALFPTERAREGRVACLSGEVLWHTHHRETRVPCVKRGLRVCAQRGVHEPKERMHVLWDQSILLTVCQPAVTLMRLSG